MKENYQLKKISILNLWFISICSLFIFSFIILFWGIQNISDALQGALLTFIILTLTGFANLMWLFLFMDIQLNNLNKHKKYYYTSSFVFSALIFFLVVFSYKYLFNQPIILLDVISLVIISCFVNAIIVTIHNYTILQDAKIIADIENSHLKVANAEAANQLLRQQIHPHFFFNALNILKSLYKVNPETADDYLVCLSDFMRTSLSSNNFKVIPLKNELQLCQDYISMQKIRFGEALLCSFAINNTSLDDACVPSFSIQPLLENAIKHNELTKLSPLHIFITQDIDRIKVTNNIKLKITNEASTGIGLANLSERYRILSGDEIFIENDGVTFTVSIKILKNKPL